MMLEDILQMPVRKVEEPIYKMPPGLDNASYVSSAGILKYHVLTANDPYLFMESDQLLPGLSERSEKRERMEKDRAERRERMSRGYENESEYEDEEEPEDGYEDEGDIYEDDEGTERKSVGELMKNLAERFKKLF